MISATAQTDVFTRPYQFPEGCVVSCAVAEDAEEALDAAPAGECSLLAYQAAVGGCVLDALDPSIQVQCQLNETVNGSGYVQIGPEELAVYGAARPTDEVSPTHF
jgi:hypothetical protein